MAKREEKKREKPAPPKDKEKGSKVDVSKLPFNHPLRRAARSKKKGGK
jgi:hypothetical protein